MTIKQKSVAGLVLLALVDLVVPLPLLGLFLIYVVLNRPLWFARLVSGIYGETE